MNDYRTANAVRGKPGVIHVRDLTDVADFTETTALCGVIIYDVTDGADLTIATCRKCIRLSPGTSQNRKD